MSGIRVVPADSLARSEDIEALRHEPEPQGAPGSLLARLRSRAKELQKGRTLDLPVPGWKDPGLVLRFKPLSVADLDRYVARQEIGKSSDVNEGIEAMAQCCVGIFANDDGRLVELADETGPLRIEHRLAEFLGADIPPDATLSPREVVLFLFWGNAFALGTYVDRLVTWMGDPSAEDDPGESSGNRGSTV